MHSAYHPGVTHWVVRNEQWRGWLIPLIASVSVRLFRRKISIGVSHFCTSCKYRHCLFKDVCIVNSFARQRKYLPTKQRSGLLTVQYNKDNVSLWYMAQAGLLAAPCKRCRFSMLDVLQLWCKPTIYSASTWDTSHHPMGSSQSWHRPTDLQL